MATSIRIPEEDRAALIALGEEIGLLPADIIRAAIKAVLKAAKSNDGAVELPLHMRTKAEEAAWAKLCDSIDRIEDSIDDGPDEMSQSLLTLINVADDYAQLSKLRKSVGREVTTHNSKGQGKITTELFGAARGAKKPTK